MSTTRSEKRLNDIDEYGKLMKLKKKMFKRRPKFKKFESWRLDRLKDYWRKPKGINNKMRLNRKGWPRSVNIGYRSPRLVRHLHSSGLEEVLVFNVGDLTIIDPENQVARIGGSVGKRKKRAIVKESKILGIKVLNPGEVLEDEEGKEEAEKQLEEVKPLDDSENVEEESESEDEKEE